MVTVENVYSPMWHESPAAVQNVRDPSSHCAPISVHKAAHFQVLDQEGVNLMLASEVVPRKLEKISRILILTVDIKLHECKLYRITDWKQKIDHVYVIWLPNSDNYPVDVSVTIQMCSCFHVFECSLLSSPRTCTCVLWAYILCSWNHFEEETLQTYEFHRDDFHWISNSSTRTACVLDVLQALPPNFHRENFR